VSRVEFIRKTYAHVALAVLAFVGFEYLLLNSELGVNIGMRMANNWIIVLVLFINPCKSARLLSFLIPLGIDEK
jgi:FtsH-binding integral membrane protein